MTKSMPFCTATIVESFSLSSIDDLASLNMAENNEENKTLASPLLSYYINNRQSLQYKHMVYAHCTIYTLHYMLSIHVHGCTTVDFT